MTLVLTSSYPLNRVVAPRLPNAPVQYTSHFHDQVSDVLRLYFNQLDNILGQLMASEALTPYYLAVARGQITGASSVNIFASSSNVGTGVPVTLWENTGVTAYVFPTTAQTMNLVSSSATDTGTAKVRIVGIDANWAAISETLTLNGTTVVPTTKQYLRVNSMGVVTPATGQTSNVGTITLKNTPNTVTYAQIAPTYGRASMSLYSVPAGYTLWVTGINAFSSDTGAGYVNYRSQTINNAVTPANTITALNTTWQDTYKIERVNPFPYTEKTDVQWQYSTNSGTHTVSLILEAVLIANV